MIYKPNHMAENPLFIDSVCYIRAPTAGHMDFDVVFGFTDLHVYGTPITSGSNLLDNDKLCLTTELSTW